MFQFRGHFSSYLTEGERRAGRGKAVRGVWGRGAGGEGGKDGWEGHSAEY